MRKYILFLFLFAGKISAYSQHIDSLYAVFSASRGVEQINAANEILNYCYENEYIVYLVPVKSSDDPSLINAYVHAAMGGYFVWEKENYEKSNYFLQLALQHYEKNGDATDVNLLNGNIGHNYSRMGDYENAVAYMMKCYEWEKSVNDYEGLSSTLTNLGVVYSQWQQPGMAIRFFEEAERVERPLNRPYNYANRLASLAKEYMNIDAQKSLPLIKEALAQDAKIERQDWKEERIAVHTASMGDIYSELDSLANAKQCYEQSLDFFEKNGHAYYMANTLLSLGRLHLKAKQYDAAIATLKECEEIAEQNNYLPVLRSACLFLGEAYSAIEPKSLSYFYHKKYSAVNDTIFKEASQKQINNFQVKYETAEKQLQIERQRTEIVRQRTLKFILTGVLIAAGLLLSLSVYTVRLRTRRNRTLTEINATKDKLFSIISHDLKNPAVTQRNGISILYENARNWNTDKISNYCGKLLKSANDNVELLYTLLSWAQTQSGSILYQPRMFDLVDTVLSETGAIQNMADGKEVILDVQLPTSALITGDDKMLATVVRNLLVNAVKFTAKGGTVTLAISPCGVSTGYTVSVTDTGIGMTAEQIHNLYSLAGQTSQRGTAGETGVGLGLIVCKEFLEIHGAVLQIQSEEGKGIRFWFDVKR
jgi:signal transduction histidine kinase